MTTSAKFISILLEKDFIDSGFYNAGFENISILDIAKLIQQKTKCEIEIKKSNDPRSYRQDSTKLINTGFSPKNISCAIDELISAFKKGKLKDRAEFHTVSWMKSQNIK